MIVPQINFTCKTKVYIGGKWLCDPTRIISLADEKAKTTKPKRGRKNPPPQKECLIYVSGGNNEVEFGNHFLDYSLARMIERSDDGQQAGKDLLPCEVHIFSPTDIQVSVISS